MLNHYSILLIGRLSAVHYNRPLQRDLSLDQAREQDELDISGVGIEYIVTATGFKQKRGIHIDGV
jgi:hypothetical protein